MKVTQVQFNVRSMNWSSKENFLAFCFTRLAINGHLFMEIFKEKVFQSSLPRNKNELKNMNTEANKPKKMSYPRKCIMCGKKLHIVGISATHSWQPY